MPISLILGPPNSGRAPELRRRLEGAISRDPVLVVPTGDDAAGFERELCRRRGAMLGVSIRTFASLFEDVARATAAQAAAPLGDAQRAALVRAAIAAAPLRLLSRSARRPGFAPALGGLIDELQAALVTPGELDAAARESGDGDYERELAALYGGYVELRRRARRSDAGSRAEAALAALRRRPESWGARPVFVYGFDDFTRAQLELLAELGGQAEVTIAINYGDREALKANAPLPSRLVHELGATIDRRLDHDPSHAEHETLRHLDRWLFEPGAPRVEPDGGIALLECAGELGEAEAIGAEVARLLDSGADAGEIAVVARDVAARGPRIGRVLARYGIPVAVEAAIPLERTAVGRSLIALCRAASEDGEPADLLVHLRADPGFAPGPADWLEREIRRRRPATVDEAVSSWSAPPRHLARLRATRSAVERLAALAGAARELAEGPHARLAPVSSSGNGGTPFEPLELRAGALAAGLLEELAEVGELPGCRAPDLAEAAEAIADAEVALWRGPSDGRVRILDPYRMRAGRARHLFCAGLQEGEFPRRGGGHPLLSDERRRRLGIEALMRRDPAEEERYLFHACVSRPTERLYLTWQSSDDEGHPSARSPFVDEVLDLIAPDPARAAERVVRRRGLDRVVFAPEEAPSERELARALAAAGGDADHRRRLDELGVEAGVGERVMAALERVPDPGLRPGPLAAAEVLEAFGSRRELSASSLEGWLGCSYRWFVDHELEPQRLDPEPDPLRLGTVAHETLQRLYAEPPGEDAIPRPADLGRWRRRLAALLDEVAREQGMRPEIPPDSASLARLRAQLEAFLAEEAELETDLRPRPELLEARFGFDGEASAPPLALGPLRLRGAIDRIDVAPDGRRALVRDYKTSSRTPGRFSWEGEGRLQLQLYVLAARESLGLDPIGGLYHPLGGRGDRRPRGLTLKGEPSLEHLPGVRGDACEPEDFDRELERARSLAIERGEAMLGGLIDRDPIGGRCPSFCTYQAICRLEREAFEGDAGSGGRG